MVGSNLIPIEGKATLLGKNCHGLEEYFATIVERGSFDNNSSVQSEQQATPGSVRPSPPSTSRVTFDIRVFAHA
jgi:hypothetical protein